MVISNLLLNWKMPLLKKFLLIIIVVAIYFIGVRKLRAAIHDLHLGSILPTSYGVIDEDSEVTFFAQSSVSYTFYYQSDEANYIWMYKIPFGSFFLFAVLGLILVNAKKNDYLILVGIHLISGLIALLFLILGLNLQKYFLIIPDLLSRYLVPLCSLGMVGYTYLKNNGKLE